VVEGEGGVAGAEGGPEAVPEEGLEAALGEDEEAAALAALPPGEKIKLPGPGKYEDTLEAARQLVRDDPLRVAQVVRRWIVEEGA